MIAKVIYQLVSAAIAFLLGLFLLACLQERERRASLLALTILIVYLSLSGFINHQAQSLPALYFIIDIFYLIAALSLLLPLSRYRSGTLIDSAQQYDERDIMFARARYMPGTDAYRDYYHRHADKKKTDDAIRALPALLSPGGKFYDPIACTQAEQTFLLIENLLHLAEGTASEKKISIEPERATKNVKEMARSFGAVDVGITTLKQSRVYSHVGRGPDGYGTPIRLSHKFVIVFAVEMDFDIMATAPRAPVITESSKRYLQASLIAIWLASYIRGLGYRARAHIDMNYQLILPAVAADAGLGETGRLGLLIHPRYGPRIRLAAVSTDLPLIADKPISFGVQAFCGDCKKCALNCPAGAISFGDRKMVRDVLKWSSNQEACYRYWRQAGTDCGMCIRVCPYSRPDTIVHNIVRLTAKNSPLGRKLAIAGDGLFYGKKILAAEDKIT